MGKRARFIKGPESALRKTAQMVGKGKVWNKVFGSLVVDSTKVRRVLEWRLPLSLEEGLDMTAKWLLTVR
jgi:UDP-glucose 4-epimerase